MYYALTDTTTGNEPIRHTNGFANTKSVLAFHTKRQRDAWLGRTRLLTARPLTRAEALKLATVDDGNLTGQPGARVAAIYGTVSDFMPDYHVMRKGQ